MVPTLDELENSVSASERVMKASAAVWARISVRASSATPDATLRDAGIIEQQTTDDGC